MERKSFRPVIKEMSEGAALVVIATLGVPDKDSDVLLPGVFGEQHAAIVGAHDWNMPSMGKARVYEKGNEAVAELRFNPDMASAREWHSSIKFDFENPPAKQEFSWGFTIKEGASEPGDMDGSRVRFLRALPNKEPGVDVHEVSPVLLGAGVNTRTLAVKGVRFADALDEALEGVKSVVRRSREILDMRQKQGRGLSAERIGQIEELKALLADVQALGGEIESVLRGDAEPEVDGARLYATYLRKQAELSGHLARGD